MGRPNRLPVHRPAQINLPTGQKIACSIRNISKTGALLSVQHAGLLPKSFELEDTFTGERWEAVVAWREPRAVGVKLCGQTPSMVGEKATGFGRRKIYR